MKNREKEILEKLKDYLKVMRLDDSVTDFGRGFNYGLDKVEGYIEFLELLLIEGVTDPKILFKEDK